MKKQFIGVLGTGSPTLLAAMKAVQEKQIALNDAYDNLKLWKDDNNQDTVPFSYFKNRVRSINEGTHLDYLDAIRYVVAEEKVYNYVADEGSK